MGDVLFLHGLEGSGPGHWQRWLAERVERVAFPELPNAFDPARSEWLQAVEQELARVREPIVLCHSLGCLLWLHHCAQRPPDGPRAARVLLVAPPSAGARLREIEDFLPVPLDPGPVAAAAAGESRLICSDLDPYCPEGAVTAYGRPLGLPTEVIVGGGHLNADAGFGPWPAAEAWARGEPVAFARPGAGPLVL